MPIRIRIRIRNFKTGSADPDPDPKKIGPDPQHWFGVSSGHFRNNVGFFYAFLKPGGENQGFDTYPPRNSEVKLGLLLRGFYTQNDQILNF